MCLLIFSLIVYNIPIIILLNFFGLGFKSFILIRGHYCGISILQTSHVAFIFHISSVPALGLVHLGLGHWLSVLVPLSFNGSISSGIVDDRLY